MRKKLYSAIVLVILSMMFFVATVKADEIKKATATAYCYNSGTTATGTIPTQGRTVASKKEYFGKTMLIWIDDGDGQIKPKNFIGTYICEDTGSEPIKKGYVVDIFIKDKKEAINFGSRKIIYQIIESEG